MSRPCWSVVLTTCLFVAGGAFSTATAASAVQDDGSRRILKVGPGEELKSPSDAARVVRSGDIIRIAPGTYTDCAIWPKRVSDLIIEGNDVTIGGRTCARKGIFIVDAMNVTIRGITFRGARSRDHNGAGIRSEARNLTVENSRFIDNENGILSNNLPRSTITIRNSYFKGNGNCISQCGHGIYINHVALVRVEGSEFVEQHEGHHVKSRAFRTELVGNTIHDGPAGDSSYLVDIPNGGGVLISGNTFEKGPNSANRTTAISIGEEIGNKGANATVDIRIENNTFKNDLPGETVFVRNRTGLPAVLRNNKSEGRVKELAGRGDS